MELSCADTEGVCACSDCISVFGSVFAYSTASMKFRHECMLCIFRASNGVT